MKKRISSLLAIALVITLLTQLFTVPAMAAETPANPRADETSLKTETANNLAKPLVIFLYKAENGEYMYEVSLSTMLSDRVITDGANANERTFESKFAFTNRTYNSQLGDIPEIYQNLCDMFYQVAQIYDDTKLTYVGELKVAISEACHYASILAGERVSVLLTPDNPFLTVDPVSLSEAAATASTAAAATLTASAESAGTVAGSVVAEGETAMTGCFAYVFMLNDVLTIFIQRAPSATNTIPYNA